MLALAGHETTVGDRVCMQASVLNVDVRDSYGFDLAETVTVRLLVDRRTSPERIAIHYDKVGGPGRVEIAVDASTEENNGVVEVSATLPDARFVNRGDHGTDLMLASANIGAGLAPVDVQTICDIEITRSFDTPARQHGFLELAIDDEGGAATPARVGLYDEVGGLPVPSNGAVAIRKFDDHTRTYLLQRSTVWPHTNRFVFYTDGRYRARVPAGRYRLIASKGIEYRMIDDTVVIGAGETVRKSVQLERYVNMPSEGWYSGDVHIHNLRRSPRDSASLLLQTRAEDVHVANILRMGNVGVTYFPQPGWGEAGRYAHNVHTLVTGQEDPRTLTLGHTIHLDLEQPVRFPDDYLNYHRVFEAVAEQGGLSGFAHAAGGLPGTLEGMTMQAVFDLLDFGEVMQDSEIGTDVWFALLNLGFRFAPAAGTDYPYIDHPGAVRGYVQAGPDAVVDDWFAGLDQGRTFVTNGPLVSFTLNGDGMGSEVRLDGGAAIEVQASAQINPDIGQLSRIELIKHGEVVASESGAGERLQLRFAETPAASAWYVARAEAARPGHTASIEAITAPVYVVVDSAERTWNKAAVPAIVERLVAALEAVKARSPEQVIESEPWDSMPVWRTDFARQLAEARGRIEATQERLRGLAREAAE